MPGRILVVDDVATNRFIARAKLTASYYDVIEVEDGEQAIEIAGREQPDLILLDVLMPGIDGFETCRRLKAAHCVQHVAGTNRDRIPLGVGDPIGNRDRSSLHPRRRSDRLDDGDELVFGTDPLDIDTDGDGFIDGEEVEIG